VSVADLEHLAQRIEDPQQRTQLLKTLQALIVVAKQGQVGVLPQEKADLSSDRSPGLFLAFGELMQRLATFGRRVSHRIATLPMLIEELPARLREPEIFWFVVYLALSMIMLVALGAVSQLMAGRLEDQLRARAPARDLMPRWSKACLALITVGLAVAPYVALLIVSGWY
jgi:hypothetical protein